MTEKTNIRDFAPNRSRFRTIEKPRIFMGSPAPLLEWLAKIVRRIVDEQSTTRKKQFKNTG